MLAPTEERAETSRRSRDTQHDGLSMDVRTPSARRPTDAGQIGMSARLMLLVSSMTSEELLTQIQDPVVLAELKRLLGIPDTVDALHQVAETLRRVDDRIERLSDALLRLAGALGHTDQTVNQLVEAQIRTDKTIEALVEAQTRTDQTLKGLAEAHARTEATLDRFMERTENFMERTDRAQTRTEETLERFLALTDKNFEAVRRLLGALSDTAGLDVEDLVSADLPDWLKRHHQIVATVQCPWLLSELGDEELDGFGDGQGPEGKVKILAEAKSRVRTRQVDAFWAKAQRVRAVVKEPVVAVLIGRAVYPDAKERAAELGLTLVSTSALRR
jgi:hypothetical protein